jgi:hypothetical protein
MYTQQQQQQQQQWRRRRWGCKKIVDRQRELLEKLEYLLRRWSGGDVATPARAPITRSGFRHERIEEQKGIMLIYILYCHVPLQITL